MPSPNKPVLALVGGTGPEGRGLAKRFSLAGYQVIIGSRSPERAQDVAAELSSGEYSVRGTGNMDAARQADIILLTIPYSAVDGTLPLISDHSRGKVVVSAIAPIEFRDGRPVALRPEAGSVAQEVAEKLPEAVVASAFQNVDARALASGRDVDMDVIVTSDDPEARHRVMDLVAALPGARALSGGRLAGSRYVEEITALLITLNRIYKTHSGIRITGIQR